MADLCLQVFDGVFTDGHQQREMIITVPAAKEVVCSFKIEDSLADFNIIVERCI